MICVRRLERPDMDAAFSLIWETFLAFEAPDYGPEGVAAFRRTIIDDQAFRAACRSGENRMWGAFHGNRLIGVFGMRGPSHICLVFSHRDYHRKGVATAIFQRLLADIRIENPDITELTLNSSPYGLPFYHRLGFVDTAKEQIADGIRFTPMRYDLNVQEGA